ncbi:MBL fold metallo-hydrolase [Lutimaribacter marinistellae]|uniref:MBL fold metallo-hydrolase n=1 Tax=Lutimaribacter marinistellae TaxID=1820329 RepID=A0ABV7TEQ9_9RHOB
MTLTRRTFLTTSSLALAGLAARPAWAATEMALGEAKLITLSDGHLSLPREFIFAPMPEEELGPVLADFDLAEGALTPPCNVTLLQHGDRNVLFDVGSGQFFMPSAGELLDALDAAGLTPEDITDVVFTHGHPDHLWGVLDDFDEPLFANASHMMGRVEWDYWWNPETIDTIGEARASMASGAKRRLEILEGSVEFFDDGEEILPGVAAVATYGHTQGHMSFEIRQGNSAAMIVGDAIGNHHVAFARPQWPSGSDHVAEQAAETRLALLDRLANEQMPLIGYHLPDGGLGRVERDGDAYRYVADLA